MTYSPVACATTWSFFHIEPHQCYYTSRALQAPLGSPGLCSRLWCSAVQRLCLCIERLAFTVSAVDRDKARQREGLACSNNSSGPFTNVFESDPTPLRLLLRHDL